MLLVLGGWVSARCCGTAFNGFAAVGAVAFFAAWSVLSNLFCALLIMVAQPFRLGDDVEVLDTAENPAPRVAWWISTCSTPRCRKPMAAGACCRFPNALFFQRGCGAGVAAWLARHAASEAAPRDPPASPG